MQKLRCLMVIGCAVVALLLQPLPAVAQAVYGSVFGTVMDNTGAVVPNVTVTVTDVEKGTVVSLTTNASGEYTAEHLIPDTYNIKIVSTGFKSFEANGIVVAADTAAKVDAKLEVGGSSETVTVNADAVPILKTDRADVSTVLNQATVENLPIGDRNFTNLQLLLPGAQQLSWSHAADENPQASKQIQVDGQAFGGVAFQLDGTDNQDPILGIIVINPPLDAVSETKITTQNFDAEFGKAVSSVVTAQTRSGSNSFHGSAFDYRESNANLATDPYTQFPGSGAFPAGLKNQFGGSIGGPILKDKLFFFGDYQGVRQKVGTAATMTVPSAHLIATCLGTATPYAGTTQGCDFSEYATALGQTNLVYSQNADGTATPYANNVIPTADLSPQALGLLKLLQPYTPNKQGTYGDLGPSNYASSGTGLFNNDQWDERVDYSLSEKTHIFERFSRFTDTLSGSTIFGAAGGAGFGINNYGGNSQGHNDSLAAGADIAISPTLLTDFRIGYYRYNIGDQKYDAGTAFASNLGMPGLNLNDLTTGAPGFNIAEVGSTVTGNSNPSNSTVGGPQYGSGLNINRCNCPLTEREDQFQIVNNWTKIIGNHSIKVGGDLRYARNLRVPSDDDRTGLLDFGTGPTSNNGAGGLGFATFVLGQATGFNRYVSTSDNAKEFQKRFFFYGQDTWRATQKLTVNYGLRYEIYFPEVVNGKGNGALMEMNSAAYTDGYLRVAGYGNIGTNMGYSQASFPLNPRIGVAYQVTPKTVIRSGYGRSFDIGVFGSIFGHTATQNLPVLANQALSQGSTTGYVFCIGPNTSGCTQPSGQPSGGGPIAYTAPTVPANGLLPAPGADVTVKARPNDLRLPTVDAWNLSIQQSITPTLSLTIAYVGNKGTHTLSAGDGNSTNPNESAIVLPASYSITGSALHYDPSVDSSTVVNGGPAGIAADGGTANVNFLQRYYAAKLPACSDPNYTNPGGTGITTGMCGWTQSIQYDGNDQDSHFNALQVTLAKQLSRNLQGTVNYAWQKGIDFASGYSTWSRAAVKGLNNDIRMQQVVMYGLYQLPFGKNQLFLSKSPTWLDEVIGGWNLSPVLNWASGLPVTLNLSNCSAWIPGSAPCYPNGSGRLLRTHLGALDPIAHRRLYFNGGVASGTLPVGFSDPGLDMIGTAGRNDALGPRFFNTDIALQKNFPIHESLFAQFRVDAYNAFNHINSGFGGSGAGVNIDQGPQYVTASTAEFGQNPRQLQFSLRLQF
ncbi:carboxypeptidase regulatory-like domain-containing protein [Silvibacterium sp.]|uniref:carboxypeptidase regulatory-like domain-containing protein n=1 Tax=Silvibacterium sp. TaxID=1964179 RepID=UPI0039E7258C